MKYIDPDGMVLINSVSKGAYSAYKYQEENDLSNIAFGLKILDQNGYPTIHLSGTKIELENGLNKVLLNAYQWKDIPNVKIKMKAFADKTDNGNYKISISISIDYITEDKSTVNLVMETFGVIAFAVKSEVGDFGFGYEQENVNLIANSVINQVLDLPNDTRLIEENK